MRSPACLSIFCLPVLSLSVLSLLAGCSTPTPARNAYGLWSGKLIQDEGECPTKEASLLRIRGHTIVFTPGNGSKVLKGDYEQGQTHYYAELTEKGMNNTPYRMTFDAYPVGEGIGGTYASPRCRAHITLVRRRESIF